MDGTIKFSVTQGRNVAKKKKSCFSDMVNGFWQFYEIWMKTVWDTAWKGVTDSQTEMECLESCFAQL